MLMMLMMMMMMMMMVMMMMMIRLIAVMIRLHQDEDSWTALHAAAANGHHRIAESVFLNHKFYFEYLKVFLATIG